MFNPFCFAISHFWKSNPRVDRFPAFGLSRDAVGDWIRAACGEYTVPAFVENDCSAWDTSVSVDALDYELRCWQAFTDVDDVWCKLFRQQFEQRCSNRKGTVKFVRKGGRGSGTGNTSIGNTLLNLSMHDHAASGIRCHIIAIGDDMLCICDAADAATLAERFESTLVRLGFQPAVKWTVDKEQAEFCSSYLADTTCGNLTLVPKTGKQLLKQLRARDLRHISAVRQGVLCGSPDPLLRDVFEKLPHDGLGGVAEQGNVYSLGGSSRMATRDSVERRYGVRSVDSLLVGDFRPGQDSAVDAIFDKDFPDLEDSTLAWPFPTKKGKLPKGVHVPVVHSGESWYPHSSFTPEWTEHV